MLSEESWIYRIHGFWAKDKPELSQIFSEGRDKVLKDHGIDKVAQNDTYWHFQEGVYVLLMFDRNDVAVAGIRLEKKIKGIPLNLQKDLQGYNDVNEFVDSFNNYVIGEVCGLWNAKSILDKNVAILLVRYITALTRVLGFEKILTFNASYTYLLAVSVGGKMVKHLGHDGVFYYPTKEYKASLFLYDDLINHDGARGYDRERIFSLRENYNQLFEEHVKSNKIIVKYEAIL
jgi:hypothetical protein